jgi:hypothetical protein
MRFLLGWTARLVHLQILEQQTDSNSNGSGHKGSRNGISRRPQRQ